MSTTPLFKADLNSHTYHRISTAAVVQRHSSWEATWTRRNRIGRDRSSPRPIPSGRTIYHKAVNYSKGILPRENVLSNLPFSSRGRHRRKLASNQGNDLIFQRRSSSLGASSRNLRCYTKELALMRGHDQSLRAQPPSACQFLSGPALLDVRSHQKKRLGAGSTEFGPILGAHIRTPGASS